MEEDLPDKAQEFDNPGHIYVNNLRDQELEADPAKLKISPSFKRVLNSTIVREDSDIDDPHYTSLKDIIQSTSPHNGSTIESNTFSSNISIRNELVKHAASVCVQSAALLVNRDQDWISSMWDEVKMSCMGFHSCLDPLRAFLHPVLRTIYYVVRRSGSVFSGRTEIT